jgi:hypothetical protein
MYAALIGEDPNTNLLEKPDELKDRMKGAGFTFLRVMGDSEQMVFISPSGTEIIISENSLHQAGSVSTDNFRKGEPPDSPANLQASLEFIMAAKTAFGDSSSGDKGGIYLNAQGNRYLAINAYAGKLNGVNILNEDVPELDQATKDKMDKIWADMNGVAPQVAPAMTPPRPQLAAPAPAGP